MSGVLISRKVQACLTLAMLAVPGWPVAGCQTLPSASRAARAEWSEPAAPVLASVRVVYRNPVFEALAAEGAPTGQIDVKLRNGSPRSVQATRAKTVADVSWYSVLLTAGTGSDGDELFSGTLAAGASGFAIKNVQAGDVVLWVGAFDASGDNITRDGWASRSVTVEEGVIAEAGVALALEDATGEGGGKIKAAITVSDGATASGLVASFDTGD